MLFDAPGWKFSHTCRRSSKVSFRPQLARFNASVWSLVCRRVNFTKIHRKEKKIQDADDVQEKSRELFFHGSTKQSEGG